MSHGIHTADLLSNVGISSSQIFDYNFKVLIVGRSGVGKTSLARKYMCGDFQERQPKTFGMDMFSISVQLGNRNVNIRIWDTAIQSTLKNYYQDFNGALLVYDVTDPDSFQTIREWQEDFTAHAPHDLVKILVGNKSDLKKERQVPRENGEALASHCRMPFFETSAKDSFNVLAVFQTLAYNMMEKSSLAEAMEQNQSTELEPTANFIGCLGCFATVERQSLVCCARVGALVL